MSSPDQPTSASPDQLLAPRDAFNELKKGKITTLDIEMPPAEAAELILAEFLPEEPMPAAGGILTASNLSLNSITIEPHQRLGNLLKADLSVSIEIKGGLVPALGRLNLTTSLFNMGGAKATKYAAYPDIPSRDQRFAGILLHNTEDLRIDFQGQGNAGVIASGIKERLSRFHKSVKDNLGKKIKEESSDAGSPKKIGEFRVFIGPDKVRVYITTS